MMYWLQEGTAKFAASETRTSSTLQNVRKKAWMWNAARPLRSQSVGSVSASVTAGMDMGWVHPLVGLGWVEILANNMDWVRLGWTGSIT